MTFRSDAPSAPEGSEQRRNWKRTCEGAPCTGRRRRNSTRRASTSCDDCGRSFNRPNELGRHRKAAHPAKKAAPAGRKPKRTRARVARAAHRRKGTVREAPVEAADQRLGRPRPVDPSDKPPRDEREEEARVEIASEIMIATANGPEAVDMERAQRIAGIILRVFDGTDRVTNGQLTDADQIDLHTLDGRMIRHEVLGQGRRAVHYWVYHPLDVTRPISGEESMSEPTPGAGRGSG